MKGWWVRVKTVDDSAALCVTPLCCCCCWHESKGKGRPETSRRPDMTQMAKAAWRTSGGGNRIFLLLLVAVAVVLGLPGGDALSSSVLSAQDHQRQAAYRQAREARISQGHTAATQALYRQLLLDYPEDVSAASHLAATSATSVQQAQVAHQAWDIAKLRQFQQHLVQARYTNPHVAAVLGVAPKAPAPVPLCPVYVTPAAAGTLHKDQMPATMTATDCCLALFLLGAAVSETTLQAHLGPDFVPLAASLSLIYRSALDPTRWIATVHIFPVQVAHHAADYADRTLYIMTDWHPRVLSHTHVGDDPAVMYLGPDSLGLVQHYWYHAQQHDRNSNGDASCRILDLCTGSGIQALYGLMVHAASDSSTSSSAVCVDVNPRALQFVTANALLNGIDLQRLTLVEGDLLEGTGRPWTIDVQGNGHVTCTASDARGALTDFLGAFDVVTANPPFLPVPPELAHRHGAFSDGGSSGEEVLAAIVRLARRVLQPTGTLAIVSEFFLASPDDDAPGGMAAQLLASIEEWWNCGKDERTVAASSSPPCGYLLTNEFPIDRDTYSTRRADNPHEYASWMNHLERIGMVAASPGFLYLQARNRIGLRPLEHVTAPRSSSGSLWTPANPDAVAVSGKLLANMNQEYSVTS